MALIKPLSIAIFFLPLILQHLPVACAYPTGLVVPPTRTGWPFVVYEGLPVVSDQPREPLGIHDEPGHLQQHWKRADPPEKELILDILRHKGNDSAVTMQQILDVLMPEEGGPERRGKIKFNEEVDDDGGKEKFKIKWKIKSAAKGKVKVKGDVDGDGKEEKCKWKDGKFKACKEGWFS